MEQSDAMECSDLERFGTDGRNNQWHINMHPIEGEQSLTIDDTDTIQRESFTPHNFASEIANVADIQAGLNEKLRLNQIRLQQLEEIDRIETARLIKLQQTIENIKRCLEQMPEEEKLETDRCKEAISKLQEVRTKEVRVNEQIEYIIQVYDDNTDVLLGIQRSFAEQRRLNCQRYVAFDATLADLHSISRKVFDLIGDKSECIKRANEKAQQYLAKLQNRQRGIEELSNKIEAGHMMRNRLKKTLIETDKSVDVLAAQLEQLEKRISENDQSYLTNKDELDKAEEEVDGDLEQIDKELDNIRTEFQNLTAQTNSRRHVLKEKNMKLEAMIEEKNRLEKEKNLKLSQRHLVDIRFSNLLETRLKREILRTTDKIDCLNVRLCDTETEVLQVSRDFEVMQKNYQSMANQLEMSSNELEMLQEKVNMAGSELHTKHQNMTLEYEEVKAKKEKLQDEGRLLCQEVNEIRAKTADLEALKETRMAQLLEKKASLDEAEKKKAQILEGEAELDRLANEQKELLVHVSRVQELQKLLDNAKLEVKNVENDARIAKEQYHKKLEEIAEQTAITSIQFNEEAILEKQAEIIKLSQKKKSTEDKLTSVKKLVKKGADRNQHLSLEARLFEAATDGLFRTIAPPSDAVTSTVSITSTEQRPTSLVVNNVTSTADILDLSPSSPSSDVTEFENNRIQIRRNAPARRRILN